MRALVAAIGLMLVAGMSMPIQVEARTIGSARIWGCTFTAHQGLVSLVESGGGEPSREGWTATGRFGWCNHRAGNLVVTTTVWQRIQDGPNIRIAIDVREIRIDRFGRNGGRNWWSTSVPNFECPYVVPVEGAPFFMRMMAKRKSHPGKVRVRTALFQGNPCSAPPAL